MSTHEQIKSLIDDNRVLLFMKGDRNTPMCGFSARAVAVVNALGLPFQTVNVLEDPAIRQGIKDYSNWPTIPQLYIDGQFVGGSDIVMQMWESGELQQLVSKGD